MMAFSPTFLMLVALPVLCLVVAVCALLGDRLLRRGRRFLGFTVAVVGYVALAYGACLVFAWATRGHLNARFHVPGVTVRSHASNTVGHADDARRTQRRGTRDKQDVARAKAPSKKSATDTGKVEHKPDTKKHAAASTPAPKQKDSAKHEAPSSAASSPPNNNAAEPASARDIELMPQAFIDFDARPKWVESEEEDLGPIHQIAVASGPFMRKREARDELSKQLKIETDRYIGRLIGSDRAATWLDYDATEIQSRFVAPDCIYDEKVVSPSFGVMHQSHALLQFGPEFRQEVQLRWHRLLALGRLTEVGLVAVGILGILAILFGYFRLDTATRGFYTGRLRFVTAVAILGLVVAAVFAARSIPWFWL